MHSLGADPAIANDMIGSTKSGWIQHQHSPGGQALTMVAAQVYGVNADAGRERYHEQAMQSPHAKTAAQRREHQARVKQQLARNDAEARALANRPGAVQSVMAMSHASQAMHDEDPVTLYRGVGNTRLNADGTHSFASDGLASFTTDRAVAHQFASMYGGRVVAVQVPRSAIVASHRAVPALSQRGESEVIVASHGQFTGREVHE